MTKPATDEEIANAERFASKSYSYDGSGAEVLSLIARIKSEQEAKEEWETEYHSQCARADEYKLRNLELENWIEALTSSIREKTIRKCANVAQKWRTSSVVPVGEYIAKAILSLLEQKLTCEVCGSDTDTCKGDLPSLRHCPNVEAGK